MAGKNQVTLTFAGDTAKLEQAFDRVGASAKEMDGKVGQAGESFDRFGERTDDLEGKAQGFRSTLTGTQDSMLGVSAIAKGDLFSGFVLLGGGIADLAEGFTKTLVPMAKMLIATRLQALAQWRLNAAFLANPIGLTIVALVALGALFVVLWNRSERFRSIVSGAFRAVTGAASAAWGWIKSHWPLLLAILTGPVGLAVAAFVRHKDRIIGIFRGIASAITGAFSAAFNGIRNFWNSTLGGKGFTAPSWVPGIGGKGFHIPRLHSGGVVPGAPGSETLALLQAGERVSPAGGRQVIEVRLTGDLVKFIRAEVRAQGGDVQAVLGR